MRFLIVVVVLAVAPVTAAEYDAQSFSSCAVCHLPDGDGVPGAFPPVRNRAAEIAALDGGRGYLIMVVAYGLMGTIQIEDVQYFGVMAGNTGALTDEDIAAALNYLVFDLNDGDAEGIEPFTAEEVAAVQEDTMVRSPAAAGQLRTNLAAKHGAEWP